MQDVNKGRLNYSSTTFFGQLKIAGVSTILNWSLVWSIILTGAIMYFLSRVSALDITLVSLSKSMSPTLLSAAAAALGVIIAALSVTVALFSKSLLPQLLASKLLHKFLFPFWYAALLWGINVIVSLLLPFLIEVQADTLVVIMFVVEVFIFIYAVFFTINLTGQVTRLALQNAQNIAE